MKNLNHVAQLKESGNYRYIGFLIEKIDPETHEEILGEQFFFFEKENKKGEKEKFFILNKDIKHASIKLPFGLFQTCVSHFMATFEIETYFDENKELKFTFPVQEVNYNRQIEEIEKNEKN